MASLIHEGIFSAACAAALFCRKHRFFEILHHWDIVGSETVLCPYTSTPAHLPSDGRRGRQKLRTNRPCSHSSSEFAEPETAETRSAGPVVRFHPGHHGRLPASRGPHTAPIVRRDSSSRRILPRIADV